MLVISSRQTRYTVPILGLQFYISESEGNSQTDFTFAKIPIGVASRPRWTNRDLPLGDEEAQVQRALRARRERRLQVDPPWSSVEHAQLRPEAVTGCESYGKRFLQ